ncbi:MarR family transcriptional regulator [Deinococcus sp. Arct2-2]|uniref:MarR family winged helix-turn-helix transcriptional regulator n=1 Tax=Deinococcus sp. Arct2-2 TaxID=2568653 RepID=UPI0010A301FD|nr:MarR family transcriptional regulator [Deinococcus sp. Arct2-2]THF67733.1 MarR family transcriptional regulator [Deinococcus sp. Arct2-2]
MTMPTGADRWTGYALAWVTSLAGQQYAEGMASLGLQPAHAAILQMLHEAGPMNQNRLAERTRIDKAPMVGLLNTLEGLTLVERRPHPRDRRAFEVHLTPEGEGKLQEVENMNAQVTETFFAPLSAAEQRTLHDLLTRLAHHHTPQTDS